MSRRRWRSAASVVRSLLARGWGSERLVLPRIRARSNIGCDVRLWVCAQTGSLGSWKSEKIRGSFPDCLAKTGKTGQFWKSGIYKLYMSKTLLLGTAGAEVIVPSIENPELSMVLSKLT